jgi:hypothetical protein
VIYTYNTSTGRLRQGDGEFEASLGYKSGAGRRKKKD